MATRNILVGIIVVLLMTLYGPRLCVTSDVSSNSSQRYSKNDQITDPSKSSLKDFLESKDFERMLHSYDVEEILRVIKNDAEGISLPLSSYNNTREVTLAFLQLNLLSIARRVLSAKPAPIWFPRPRDVSSTCYNHLMIFFESLVGRTNSSSNVTEELMDSEDWALSMFDAFGKPNSGILEGRLQFIGGYDMCIKIKARTPNHPNANKVQDEEAEVLFGGRYCRARLPMGDHIERKLPDDVNTFWLDESHLPININWGLCVPDTCSGDDLKTFFTNGTLGSLNLPVAEVTCYEDPKLTEDPGALFVIVLLTLFGTITLICTVLDFCGFGGQRMDSTLYYWFQPQASITKHTRAPDAAKGDVKQNGTMQHTEAISQKTDFPEESLSPKDEGASVLCTSNGIGAPGCGSNDISDSPNADIEDTSPQALPITEEEIKVDVEKDVVDKDNKGVQNEAFEMCDLGDCGVANGLRHDSETKWKCGVSTGRPESDIRAEIKNTPAFDVTKASAANSQSETLTQHFIKGASLYHNFLHLTRTKTESSKPTIKCLEGLKAITMAWIVLGHTYTFGGIIDDGNVLYDNSLEMTNIPHRLAFHIVGSAQFGVDTFFVICGCLVMFISLEKLHHVKDKWSFWTLFVFHRFWRLTPIYMMVLAIGTTLYEHIVNGPLKAPQLEEFHECRSKWWSHLLYINNFYRPEQKCMTWTWYLAVDMQFHVLSPLFIYPVFRNRQLGAKMIICLALLGMVSALGSELAFGGQFLLMDMNFLDYWSYVYTMPWCRAAAFAIGLYLGVLLREINGDNSCERFLQGKWTRRLFTPIMWIFNLGVGVGLALMTHVQWKHGSGHWDRPALAAFECLSRPLWSFAVAWVIFACNTNRAGPIAKILSWPPFVILSRLSYSMYLMHPLVILFVVYSRRTAIYLHPNRIDQAYNYLGHLTFTFLFAVVLYLLVEAPLQCIEVLWKPRQGNHKVQQDNHDQENTTQNPVTAENGTV